VSIGSGVADAFVPGAGAVIRTGEKVFNAVTHIGKNSTKIVQNEPTSSVATSLFGDTRTAGTIGYKEEDAVATLGSGTNLPEEIRIKSIADLASRPSILTTFKVSVTDTPGKVLCNIPLWPGVCKAKQITSEKIEYDPTVLSFLTNMYFYNHVDLDIGFSLMKNKLDSLILKFAVVPNLRTTENVSAQELENVPNAVMDCKIDDEVVIRVPFFNVAHYHIKTRPIITNAGLLAQSNIGYQLVAYVETPLIRTSPDLPAYIDCVVTISGRNPQFACPKLGSVSPFSTAASRSAEDVGDYHAGGMPDTTEEPDSTTKIIDIMGVGSSSSPTGLMNNGHMDIGEIASAREIEYLSNHVIGAPTTDRTYRAFSMCWPSPVHGDAFESGAQRPLHWLGQLGFFMTGGIQVTIQNLGPPNEALPLRVLVALQGSNLFRVIEGTTAARRNQFLDQTMWMNGNITS
jgi:hypothetical protein